ncbi:glycosyltransferase [Cellulomonas sp. JZ18]|uniref:glycosyltransferase n=1 Tax=Cellulomonas sp. JZ18 TaxID=2654191 RepID=UPI0012D45667|nr:glycosyltransferase family 2 protein [Cellulomonas sp. JZ18]QGQ20261.1 glycosyltransferase [Cellulomonas sp. JZ18]
MSTDWTLVTVTYNNAAELRQFWSDVDLAGARWIVVDNASADGSADVARALGADVVALERNVGFGAANNVGLRVAESEWLAFVNPDVRVDPASFAQLAATSRRYGALVAPALRGVDGSVQPNGRGLPYPTAKLAHRGLWPGRAARSAYVVPPTTEPVFVAWVMGAAVAGPTAALRRLGGWDERYFIYYEDHDLGLRAWRHGMPVVVDPHAAWTHEWKRATTGLSWLHWKHELRSGLAFYRAYPELLLGPRSARRRNQDAARWTGRKTEERAQ